VETKVRPLGTLRATVGKRLADTAARGRLKEKPSFRFGLSTVRFGLITVAVIAAGVALLTWLPSDAYNQPITHPVKAIADSVTKEPPKAEESKAVNVVRKGLETVSAGILAPSDQPASPSSVAPVPQAPAASEPPPAPKASTPTSGTAPTPALSADTPESYEEPPALPATPAPVLEPEPAPAYDEAPLPAATPEPAPAYDEAPPPYEEPPPADPGALPPDQPTDPGTAPSPPQGQVDGCEPPNCTITQDPGPNSEPDRK
jgi:hypothetical protein